VKKSSKSNNVLLALTTAALSLPGIIPKPVQAEEDVPDKFSFDYRKTEYEESRQPQALDGDTVVIPETERFDISIQQFNIRGPVGDKVGLNIDFVSETLSGASPWYIVPSSDGEPIQIMSGASIYESRQELNIGANLYNKEVHTGVTFTSSQENDYKAAGLHLNNALFYNGNNTTLNFGVGFSSDQIQPTQQVGVTRVTDENKNTSSFFAGVSQVLSKTLLLGANLSYKSHQGFLSDPYKQAYVNGLILADSRPDDKNQFAIDLQLRKYLTSIDSALHVDYRLYSDNWGVDSNTISLGIYKDLSDWLFSAKLRYYDQSSASFYRDFYTAARADGFYSSDYRLSEYDAMSMKFGLNKNFDSVGFNLNYEVYESQGNGSNPGLVDFTAFTLGFNFKF
jgi:hypothetical protein